MVGRDRNRYVIHFESMDDLLFVNTGGPWTVQGGLLTTVLWHPNLVVRSVNVRDVPIWVEFWGLPLEFQVPRVARKAC